MDSVVVSENLPANSLVKQVTPVFAAGPGGPVTYSFVNGKFGIDNAKFTISPTGEIRNIALLATGTYNIRYKVQSGASFIEKPLKVYTDDKKVTITISSPEYPDSIAIDDVVGTVSLSSGSLTDVTITPLSDSDDPMSPAFYYDGSTGEIKWSADQSPADYEYQINYSGQCLKSSEDQLFEVESSVPIGLSWTQEILSNYVRTESASRGTTNSTSEVNSEITTEVIDLDGDGDNDSIFTPTSGMRMNTRHQANSLVGVDPIHDVTFSMTGTNGYGSQLVRGGQVPPILDHRDEVLRFQGMDLRSGPNARISIYYTYDTTAPAGSKRILVKSDIFNFGIVTHETITDPDSFFGDTWRVTIDNSVGGTADINIYRNDSLIRSATWGFNLNIDSYQVLQNIESNHTDDGPDTFSYKVKVINTNRSNL